MKIFLLFLSFAFLATACRVESMVVVNVQDDGSGSVEVIVELDDDWVSELGQLIYCTDQSTNKKSESNCNY